LRGYLKNGIIGGKLLFTRYKEKSMRVKHIIAIAISLFILIFEA